MGERRGGVCALGVTREAPVRSVGEGELSLRIAVVYSVCCPTPNRALIALSASHRVCGDEGQRSAGSFACHHSHPTSPRSMRLLVSAVAVSIAGRAFALNNVRGPVEASAQAPKLRAPARGAASARPLACTRAPAATPPCRAWRARPRWGTTHGTPGTRGRGLRAPRAAQRDLRRIVGPTRSVCAFPRCLCSSSRPRWAQRLLLDQESLPLWHQRTFRPCEPDAERATGAARSCLAASTVHRLA